MFRVLDLGLELRLRVYVQSFKTFRLEGLALRFLGLRI